MADGTAGRAEGKREKWKHFFVPQKSGRFLPEHWINVVPSIDRLIIRMVTGLDGFAHVI